MLERFDDGGVSDLMTHHHHHHHHHTQCILPIENYGQGLGRERRRQFIPIKENAAKESLDLKRSRDVPAMKRIE